MMFAYGEPVTRLRAARTPDPYNPELFTLDWDNAKELVFPSCAVWDSGTAEPNEVGRDPADADITIALPAGADVLAEDRVVVRGIVCEVVGRPFDWVQPFTGWRPGVIVKAKVRDG